MKDAEANRTQRHTLRLLAADGAEQAARSLRHLGAALDRIEVDSSADAARTARAHRDLAIDGATILRVTFTRLQDPRVVRVEALLRWLEMPQASSADRWARVVDEMGREVQP